MNIQDLIATVNDQLTPTERRIVRAVTADPTLLAFGTVSDLARRVQTSPPSIVRFAAKLGFDGYRHLQAHVRDSLSRQLSRPAQRVRHSPGSLRPIRESVEDAVRSTFEALDEKALSSLAEPLVRASNVWIVSGETSMVGALTLRSGLSMVRPHVHFVEEHSTGRDLSFVREGDAAAVFDFPRYRRQSIISARALAKMKVDLVAITDGPLSPLASLTNNWVGLAIPAVGPFDSSVPAVIAAELLVARVVQRLGAAAREQIDRLESLWRTTETFMRYTPRDDRRTQHSDMQ